MTLTATLGLAFFVSWPQVQPVPIFVPAMVRNAHHQQTKTQKDAILCNAESIREAGSSRNQSKVVELRELRRDCDSQWRNISLALAKLGQRSHLQRTWCEVVLEPSFEVAQDLIYLGGWFSVRAALRLGNQNELWNATFQGDALVAGSPRLWAMEVLTQIVPNPPAFTPAVEHVSGESDPANAELQLRNWKKWIAKNTNKLAKLKPIGRGVRMTDAACK